MEAHLQTQVPYGHSQIPLDSLSKLFSTYNKQCLRQNEAARHWGEPTCQYYIHIQDLGILGNSGISGEGQVQKKWPPSVTIRVKINPFHTSFIFILPISDMLQVSDSVCLTNPKSVHIHFFCPYPHPSGEFLLCILMVALQFQSLNIQILTFQVL